MSTKCQFRKKDGSRCRANAQPNGQCVFHDPEKAADGRRARQAGGISRSRVAAVLPRDTPDCPLENPRHVAKFLAQCINQLLRGQLDPKVANAIGYQASVLLRSLEQKRLEEPSLSWFEQGIEEILSAKGGNRKEAIFQAAAMIRPNSR